MNLNFHFGDNIPPDDDDEYYRRRRYNNGDNVNVSFSQTNPKVTRNICLVIFVVGLAILVYGILDFRSYVKKAATFSDTTGTVVDYSYSTSTRDDYGNYNVLRAEIVEYVVDGNEYTCKSGTYSNNYRSIGSQMDIKYNPEDPSDAYIASDGRSLLPLLCGAMMTIVGGIFAVIYTKRANTLAE